MEDDDVADLRVTEVVAHAVDQHPLTDVQGRLHRPGGDLVRLDEKGLDQERQPDRKRHDHHELDERSAARGGFRDQRIQPPVRAPAPTSAQSVVVTPPNLRGFPNLRRSYQVGISRINRIAAGAVVCLLVVGALAVAGCGGGSSSSTAASDATSTASTTTSSANANSIPPSTAIASSAYFNALAQAFSQSGQLSTSQAQSAAHCVQDGLTKAGFKTQGDAEGANAKKALQTILPCIQKAKSQ